MKSLLKKSIAFMLAFVMIFGSIPLSEIEVQADSATTKTASKVNVPDNRVYITSQTYDLVPGAQETVLTTNNEAGTNQRIGFIMTVDAEAIKSGAVKPVATYKDYEYDGVTFGMQTVTDQAKAYVEAHEGEKAIAGINADFYNLNTGEPTGTFIMEGKVLKSNKNTPYIAILNDGTVEIRKGSNTDYTNVKEAVSGNMQILTDGVVTVEEGDYQTLSYSRTGVGVKADGSIVTYVTHGISVPTSCGETYVDVAEMLLAQGCVNAIMLDGGGSATYASTREGEEEFTVKNNPSDGTPRTVSNCLIFTSTLQADGEFDHASVTPNNEFYTPSNLKARTKVQMKATGIDGSGAECDLPEGLTWALADDSSDMGSIDAETGIFTAAIGKTGAVTINLLQGTEVVGSTTIGLAKPDEIAFSGTAVSLNFGDMTDLGLTAKSDGIVLNTKDGDFTWTVESTLEGVDSSLIGSVENNIFTAGSKQDFALEGTVTAAYSDEVTATIIVEIGRMPIVAMDFEDVDTNVRGKDVVGLWDWGTITGYFTDATEAQVYEFQNYDVLYYLQSTTYGSDSLWINEVYTTDVQPWVENEDGTITLEYNGETCTGTKESTYGEHAQKWVSFTTSDGAGYYWRGYIDADTWSGNFNAGGGSASAFLAADGYDMYVWHTSANPSSLSALHGEGSQIVDESEGEVRFGDYALKLTYDFRNFSPITGTKNCNTYYRMTDPLVASGSPTGLGMWVYAPESMDNFWFWTQLTYWNGSAWADAYIHFKPAGAEKTCQYTGVNWTGWTYVEADLTAVYEAGAIVDADHPLQIRSGNPLILLTYIPGGTSDGEGHAIVMGSKTKGEFYIDNVRWVYGTNIDDMDSPQIISAQANETMLSAEKTTILDVNDIIFDINFTDPQGENYSGIDEQATQIYLDGSPLSTADYTASADRAQTNMLSLANGEHTLLISICDNFGNRTEQTYTFEIENPDSTIPEVTIQRAEKAELGGDYVITIESADLDEITSVSTNITYGDTASFDTKTVTMSNTSFYDDYGNLLTQGDDGYYYDANGTLIEEPIRPNAAGTYSVSSAVQVVGENLTGKIRNKVASATTRVFTAEATVNESLTNDNTILTFTMPIPTTLAENITFPCSVTVTYTTKDGNTYTVTTGDMTKEIYAYYTLEPGVQVAGAANGVIDIVTVDGTDVSADNVTIYSGEETLTGTFEDNTFTTDYFVTKTAGDSYTSVYIADTVNKHYSYLTTVSVAAGAEAKEEALHFDLTLNATTGDSATEEKITWLAAFAADEKAMIQYMPKADYNAEASDPFENAVSVEGTSKLTYFATEGTAAYVNKVELTGLAEGTTYVYRAGDGTNWSETAEFSTMTVDGSTKFMVMADVQLGSSMSEEDYNYLSGIANATTDIDFGIQTGDFTDNPDSFVEWDNILQTWQDLFTAKDFVHVIGNHELYGTGAGNSTAILGLTSSQKDFYSVEYGDVYVAVINQSADLNEAAAWLVEDAANTECTWKVLVCHQPIYYTNPNGSNDGHHKVLKVACDAAGIDFTFSGHDHSYARTEQLKAGVALDYATEDTTNAYVDADGNHVATKGQGIVYYVCGDLGEKSRESGYKLVDNPDFHFAKASQDYDALYLTLEATENKITVNTWDMAEDGTASLFDTFTMYTNKGICAEQEEHLINQDEVKYDATTGKLICDRCGEEVDPAAISYTGFAVNVNGEDEYGDSQYYFLAGKVRTGFFAYGELFYYANEAGLIDHLTKNSTTNTCTTNGNKVAYSPRYNKSYTGGIERFTGHFYVEQEDGSLVCSVCDHVAIDTANWNYALKFTTCTYSGTAKMPAITITNPETGETLEYATDGMGKLTDYTRVWNNNKNVGTATVTIEMNPEGDYTNSKGAVVLTLKINPASPASLTVDSVDRTTATLSWPSVKQATGYRIYRKNGTTWTKVGETSELTYTVKGLNAGSDYTFAVRAITVIDDTTYISTGYNATADTTTEGGMDISDWNIKLSFTKTTYNGNNKRPTATVTDADGNVMTRNVDYTIQYIDNKNAGTATVTVTGIGVYEGTKSTTFTIAAQNIKDAVVTATDAVYNGTDVNETTVTVTDKNGLTMTEGTDYTVTFSENDSVGTAIVTITGKGNYTGTISANYEVTPCDVATLTAVIDEKADLTYTGSAIEPGVTIAGLKEGTDYTVTYKKNINVADSSKIVIKGCGNYTGTLKVAFSIEPRDVKDFTITDGSTYTYTGKAIEADLNVQSDLGAILVKDTDYVVKSYENNVNKGTATVVIEGIGNYTGTASHQFVIESAKIDAFTVKVDPEAFVYDGTEKKPAVTVTDEAGNVLVEDTDYTVEYTNNIAVGTATVTVTGIGNYQGTASRNYVINAVDIATTDVTLSYTKVTYSGSAKKPAVTVTAADGTTLVADTDYTVAYENNKNAGTANVIVTGIGNYTGSVTKTFTINQASIAKCTVTLSVTEAYYTGNEIKPGVTVKTAKGTTLRNGVNYEVVYTNNVEVGTATVTIKGINNYKSSQKLTFTILKSMDISLGTAKLNFTTATYNGNAKRPGVTVTAADGTTLKKGTDYTVEYLNNVEVGTATVIITGIGEYRGTITKTFKIRPEKPTNLTVASKTKTTIKVQFDRVSSADKYYIYVNGVYKGCTVTKDYYTIKGLTAGTTYKIYIKAVKEVDGVNYYSAASSTISVTTNN